VKPDAPRSSTGTLVGGLAWRRLAKIDEAVRALLEATNFCVVATLRDDGAVHSIPVWVDTDGEHVLLNSTEGRGWVRNVDRDPRVTCTIVNAHNPYEFVEIRGRLVERTYEGGNDQIHRLAKKYLGVDEYPWLQPGERRILLKVAPETVLHMQPSAAELAPS
jgi:PPOX class probable F420-dependent enzyme